MCRALSAEAESMNGLYALKPWYAERLAAIRDLCVRHGTSPDTLSLVGAGAGAGAGIGLALLPAGPLTAASVGTMLALRLAATNLDGEIARSSGRCTRRGAVLGEFAERTADLAALAGLATHLPLVWMLALIIATSIPSWISLAGAGAGGSRLQGGPVGKTERAAILLVVAATGWYQVGFAVLVAGSLVTGLMRATRLLGAGR